MKRSTLGCTILVVAFAFSLSPSTQAQDSKAGDNTKTAKTNETPVKKASPRTNRLPKEFKIPFHPEDVNGPSPNIRLNRELRYVKKFKLLIAHQMDFSTEDQEKVFAVIDDHISGVLDKYETLEKQNRFKRVGRNGPRQLSNKMEVGKGTRMELVLYHMKDFFANIMKVIPEKHRKGFDDLYLRWDLTHHGPVPDDPIRRLNRVVTSHLMDIGDENRKKVAKIFIAKMREIGRKGRLDPVIVNKAYQQLRADVFKLLTKEQKIEADKSMRLIDDFRKIMELD